MKVFNLHPAKTQLSALVDEAAAGAEIVIAKMAKLVPFRETTKRKPGRLKGRCRSHSSMPSCCRITTIRSTGC